MCAHARTQSSPGYQCEHTFTMKLLILSLCVAAALAKPDVSHLVTAKVGNDREAQILKYSNDQEPNGKYYWEIETDNGINAHEHGEDTPDGNLVGGKVNYLSPEGEQIALSYSADSTGYHPEGAHLPTPPPIPDYILRALKYIVDHPPPPPSQARA